MELPENLVSRFVKSSSSNASAKSTKVTEYGTIVNVNGTRYVQIDGSQVYTPFITRSDVKDGERVSVEVIGHQAIVTGNYTNPSIGVKTVTTIVDRIDGDIGDLDDKVDDVDNKLSTEIDRVEKEAAAEREKIQKRADEAEKDRENIKKKIEENDQDRKKVEEQLKKADEQLKKDIEEADKAAADAASDAEKARHVAVDYIEGKQDGFYVGNTSDSNCFNVRIYAGGIEIRKGGLNGTTATVLSNWDASELVLGQKNKFHTVLGIGYMSFISEDSQTLLDIRTGGITVGRKGTLPYAIFGNNGIHLYDEDGVEYAKYSTTETTIGYTGKDKLYLSINSSRLAFKLNDALVSSFAADKITIGYTDKYYLNLNSTSVSFIADGKTVSSFSGTNIVMGPTSGYNLYLDSASFQFRQNGTVYAKYTGSEIILGGTSTSIKLCGSKGSINYNTINLPNSNFGEIPPSATGLNITSNESIVLKATTSYYNAFSVGNNYSFIHMYKTGNYPRISLVVAHPVTAPSSAYSKIDLGYYTEYGSYGINIASPSIELDSTKWVWLSGWDNDTSSSPGFALFGFNYIDIRQRFRDRSAQTTMRIDVDTFYIYPAGQSVGGDTTSGCRNIYMYASNWFYVNSPYVEFTGVSTFKVNSTNWLNLVGASTASLYESQIQQSEAIVQLFENQMVQNEAIVALYESTL